MQTNDQNSDYVPDSTGDYDLVRGAARSGEEIVPPPASGYAPARTYASNDHDSHWPVGCASVVVAENEEQARELLDAQLVANGLKPHKLAPYTLREVVAGEAVVLANGDY